MMTNLLVQEQKLCHIMDNINAGLLHRAFSVFYSMKMGNYYYNNELMKNHFRKHVDKHLLLSSFMCSSELGVDSSLEGSKDVNNLTNAVKGAKVAAQRKLEHELGIPFEDAPIEISPT